MVPLTTFLFIYLLGGLTLIPAVSAIIFLHWKYGAKRVSQSTPAEGASKPASNAPDLPESPVELPAELKKYVQSRRHDADVAAGYFAVCREYVPGGVNGKPPERTTPAGAVVANESPSVYQSMYRGIFGRDKNAAPTIQNDAGKGNVKVKKGRNVFYVVLRLGHLMLYDDAEQLEVRHVISLAHHGVDIYGGGETIPEGELFVKRNCIRLSSRRLAGDLSSESRPFYLFSENCSEKEDFYHALLQNQERRGESPDNPPTPLQFDQAHLIKLVQQIHASEEDLQTRWLNAIIGRVFLGMYKTAEVEALIRAKMNKKISRVPKPNFISSITLGKIHMGDAAPMFTNPKLRELTMAGDVTIEADVKYNGGFRIEVAAVARIDLGKRMGGVRELNLQLAVVAKKVEGHMLFRIKPPPSNRLWFSFETAPKMDVSIEPIVAQRQITYGFVLRAIESRIREVLAETLVFPNYDDVPFHDTLLQRFRGGIWEDDVKANALLSTEFTSADADETSLADETSTLGSGPSTPGTPQLLSDKGKTMSTPFLANTAPVGLTQRNRAASRTLNDLSILDAGSSSGVDSSRAGQGFTSEPNKPKALRSNSFASPRAAEPILHSDPITIDSKSRSASGGASSLKGLNAHQSLSRSTSPRESPVGSPERSIETAELMRQAIRSTKQSVGSIRSHLSNASDADTAVSREELNLANHPEDSSTAPVGRISLDLAPPHGVSHSRNGSTDMQQQLDSTTPADDELESVSKHAKRVTTLKMLGTNAAEKRQSLNAAASAAKRWGLGVIAARQNAKGTESASERPVSPTTVSSEDRENSELVEAKQDDETSTMSSDTASMDGTGSAPTSARASRILDLGRSLERTPSPSMIPRRIGSTRSVSSTSSSSTNRPNRQSSPQPSRIPSLRTSTSNKSLSNAHFSPTASSPAISPSNFTNTSVTPSQQETDGRLRTSHTRTSSAGVVHGPGSPSMPIGRGQPLPPPGKPLPGPKGGTWVGAAGAMLSGMRRKPVATSGSARNGSVDGGRPQRNSISRQQDLEAKRKQYEQEKHIIGAAAAAAAEAAYLDAEPNHMNKNENDLTRSNSPPPLPQRPAAAYEGWETDARGNGLHTASPFPKRTSSIPVTKRPVPKPPLPARKAPQLTSHAQDGDITAATEMSDGQNTQQDSKAAKDDADRVQHERLEHLDPDAVLRDEEEFANELATPEQGDDDEHNEYRDERNGSAPTLESKGINVRADDDEETFGPMEMNVPESPASTRATSGDESLVKAA